MKFDKDTNTLMGVRVALFDLDGTLFDSIKMWEQLDVDYLKKRGLVPTDEYRTAIAALGNLETARFSVRYFNLNESAEQLAAEWTEMAAEAYATTVGLYPGAKEYVQAVKAEGIKIYAVTSLDKRLVMRGLIHNEIAEYFDGVITADDTGLTKKSKDIYLVAARAAGENAHDCVAFDDVGDAIYAAQSAGMTTVAVGRNSDLIKADYTAPDLRYAPALKK